MKKIFILIAFLLILSHVVSCSGTRNAYYNCGDANDRFTEECLRINYPFSIKNSTGKRYGVFIDGNTVKFIYPRSAVWLDELELYAFPDDEDDMIYVPIQGGSFEGENWFTLRWEEKSGNYTTETVLPDGVYLYWGVELEYNPCWYYEDIATDNFFVVGNEADAIFQHPRGIYNWSRWDQDTEPHQPR